MTSVHPETAGKPVAVTAIGLVAVACKAVQLAWWPDESGEDLLPALVRQVLLLAAVTAWLKAQTREPLDRLAAEVGATTSGGAAKWSLAVLGAFVLVASALSSPPGLAVVNLVVVTAFGEELLFRGLLLAMADRCGDTPRRATVRVSVLFGLWHIPDAAGDGALWLAASVVFPALASALALVPLRRRTGSVLPPTAAHAVVNGGLLMATDWT
jgi:membrane protease YdiL (CAAX protease family)